jgi:hypothetical protein
MDRGKGFCGTASSRISYIAFQPNIAKEEMPKEFLPGTTLIGSG